MARMCEVCGKGVTHGHLVSHSNIKTNRTWSPNVQRVRARINGTVKHLTVCTRCLRSGKVERVI